MKILLVEDNERVAQFIRKGLAEVGHTVDHAHNGREGLFLAATGRYDAIVLDRMLPGGIDGLGIVESLRKTQDRTPILILSALAEVDDRIHGLRAGGDDYLTKPFAFGELLARLEALARRSQQVEIQTALTVADLRIDLLSHKATRAGKPIQLQRREFKLLEFLMRHAGQVVTRTMLLENVWEHHFDPQTNVIDVHISRLRQKIDEGFDRPLLQTVRGFGYRLGPVLSVLRSTSVRLALGYAVLFVVSSLLLVGLLWWRMAGYLERKTDSVIRADTQAIRDDFRFEGLPGAVEMINESLSQVADGSAVYLLADAALKPVAGNLGRWPPALEAKPGWYELPLFVDDRVRIMRIREVALANGFHLLVGRDIRDQAEVRALIIDGLSWAAVSALVLAVVGGVLVRRAVLRRVENINRTTSAIVRGDLARRLPTRGTTDELDQLSQTINSMLRQIEDLIEGIRNTSNAVAHDLRTPLAELRAQLEGMVLAGSSREAMLEGVQKALADIDRVIGIFNALLRLAEIDSGLRRSGFRRVELAELATEVGELYGPLIEEKQASFIVDAPSGLAVHGDPYLLAQAVGNLVDNAVKYAPRHGMISLRIRRAEDRHIEIVVADDGPGIVDAEKTRVTRRFYRCGANGATAGIGLGLSVVDAVARLHDGTLTFSDNHPGLIAMLKLPAVAGERASPLPASVSSVFSSA